MKWFLVNIDNLPAEYEDLLLFDKEMRKKRIGVLSDDRWLFDDGTEVLVSIMAVSHYSELLNDPTN